MLGRIVGEMTMAMVGVWLQVAVKERKKKNSMLYVSTGRWLGQPGHIFEKLQGKLSVVQADYL